MIEKKEDYSVVTEAPGLGATAEQIERLYTRYRFARRFASGKDVLEVACGSGIGLGYLAEAAARVVGGDINEKNVALARRYYGNGGRHHNEKIEIDLMDAHKLPFGDSSVDLVLLFEAIYYLKRPGVFAAEAHRVLRPGGKIIICTDNKDLKDFHPSPYTYSYPSVPELHALLKDRFRTVEVYGGFRADEGFKARIVSSIKRAAVALNLIPGSLAARAYLKRIFIGKLQPLPETLHDGTARYEAPTPLPPERVCTEYKVLYAVACK